MRIKNIIENCNKSLFFRLNAFGIPWKELDRTIELAKLSPKEAFLFAKKRIRKEKAFDFINLTFEVKQSENSNVEPKSLPEPISDLRLSFQGLSIGGDNQKDLKKRSFTNRLASIGLKPNLLNRVIALAKLSPKEAFYLAQQSCKKRVMYRLFCILNEVKSSQRA
ncbi:MAG: hypothetical protein GQ574_04070 [Crocinitomix sp.]|nr:hypothetical protein [Crocinitomix sp.]